MNYSIEWFIQHLQNEPTKRLRTCGEVIRTAEHLRALSQEDELAELQQLEALRNRQLQEQQRRQVRDRNLLNLLPALVGIVGSGLLLLLSGK